MECDVVALAIEFSQTHEFDAEIFGDLSRDVGIVRKDAHLERLRAFHHFASDAAEANDPERLTTQFTAEKFLLLPFAGFRRRACLRDKTRHGEHERESVLGYRYRVSAGRVHH